MKEAGQMYTLESGIDWGSGINGGMENVPNHNKWGSGINGLGGKFPKSKQRGA